MTERFRYPPKGYQKHVPSQQLSDGDDLRADRTNPTNNTSLTSSISQKIQLDRIQEENRNSKRRTGENIRPKSGRISGIKYFQWVSFTLESLYLWIFQIETKYNVIEST